MERADDPPDPAEDLTDLPAVFFGLFPRLVHWLDPDEAAHGEAGSADARPRIVGMPSRPAHLSVI